MGPDAVTSLVLRMCVEVTPPSSNGNHLPFILLMHLVMIMRNVVCMHNEEDMAALLAHLLEQVQGMKKVGNETSWLAGAMRVSRTTQDVRPCIMASKHIQKQPGELNSVLAFKMRNPQSLSWSWLCRNLRLRTRSYLRASPTPIPKVMSSEAAAVEQAVKEQVDATLVTLPTHCIPLFTRHSGETATHQAVAYMDFNWGTLHRESPVSAQLLAAARDRLLRGIAEDDGPSPVDGSATADAGAALSPAPGPTVRVGRTRPPTGRAGLPAGSTAMRKRRLVPPSGAAGRSAGVAKRRKTARSLRSPRVQEKMNRAHEAVVAAIMEEDERAAVAKPSDLVQQVSPNKLWPDGGVVVYAQFPFLLDLSWKQSGSWVALCRKAVCSPDGTSHGGT